MSGSRSLKQRIGTRPARSLNQAVPTARHDKPDKTKRGQADGRAQLVWC